MNASRFSAILYNYTTLLSTICMSFRDFYAIHIENRKELDDLGGFYIFFCSDEDNDFECGGKSEDIELFRTPSIAWGEE